LEPNRHYSYRSDRASAPISIERADPAGVRGLPALRRARRAPQAEVLHGISLTVEPGEVVVMLGDGGCSGL
jgi:ABC-type multidrug transport system ATPase subunit